MPPKKERRVVPATGEFDKRGANLTKARERLQELLAKGKVKVGRKKLPPGTGKTFLNRKDPKRYDTPEPEDESSMREREVVVDSLIEDSSGASPREDPPIEDSSEDECFVPKINKRVSKNDIYQQVKYIKASLTNSIEKLVDKKLLKSKVKSKLAKKSEAPQSEVQTKEEESIPPRISHLMHRAPNSLGVCSERREIKLFD